MTKYSSVVVAVGYLLCYTCDVETVHKSSAFRLMFLTRAICVYYTTPCNIRFKQTQIAGLLCIHKVFLAPVPTRPSGGLYNIIL